MNRDARTIVDDCTAADLPENVRNSIAADRRVKVTIDRAPVEPRILKFRGIGAHRRTTIEEAVARVRSLRDDWD